MVAVPDVPGVLEVMDWFGEWPSFHDAEVTRIYLNRCGPSYMDVHVFRITSEVTPSGYLRCDKHAVITFEFESIIEMELFGFDHQNVISELEIVNTAGLLLKVILLGCYGATGFAAAEEVSLSLMPGAPIDSQYRKLDGYEDV